MKINEGDWLLLSKQKRENLIRNTGANPALAEFIAEFPLPTVRLILRGLPARF